MTIAIEAMPPRSYRLAWAHVRDTGVVQALYKPCGDARWCFVDWEVCGAGQARCERMSERL